MLQFNKPLRNGYFSLSRWLLSAPARIAIAPLTHSCSRQPGNIPAALNACYYAQRASAALIVLEATHISQQGQGYAWTPGIHSLDQVEGCGSLRKLCIRPEA